MKWKLKPNPKVGDTRTVTRFAWLPVVIDDYWVWLETFHEEQKYVEAMWHSHDYGGESGAYYTWETVSRKYLVPYC